MYRALLAMCVTLNVTACSAESYSTQLLQKYQHYLDVGVYTSVPHATPALFKARSYTFARAFEYFEKNNGKVIVELGTTRSFVHGGLPGCCSSNTRYWQPHNPESWDWGAGSFTRIAAECLAHCNPVFHTVDCNPAHIAISRVITNEYAHHMRYHVNYSQNFLRQCPPESIDLLYMDTGNIDEQATQLHLEEAKIIVENNVIARNGIILIDDVRHPIPGEPVPLGKARYSIPYLLEHGFEIMENEYQVILRRVQ